uniref:MRN complex-interacting protein N-terminal domain-containing protein n=1 Tax=Leersia perrieri TaxID=77586 RepID=A0A0D9V4Y7_9ORYZ
MATTLFLALQCVQCSTMQVRVLRQISSPKPPPVSSIGIAKIVFSPLFSLLRFDSQVKQQKSSNKWVCAVCNQRQSVMRIHARGYRAADVRRFVQDANLSRGRAAQAPVPVPEEDWVPALSGEQQDEFPRERKRRMDWSEYLDDPGECDGGGDDEEARDGGTGIQVTTELPEQRLKVTSSKRPSKAQLGLARKRPKTLANTSLPKMQLIGGAQISKWSNYLDTGFFEEKSRFQESGQHCTEVECSTTDVLVDDEWQSYVTMRV